MTSAANQKEAEFPTASPERADPAALRFGTLDIRLVHDLSSIEAEWRRLEQREWNSLNQGLDWAQAWMQAHGAEMIAVTGSIGKQTAFILPLEITRERLGRVARPPGGRFNNINTGLFDEQLATPDAEELARFKASIAQVLRGIADLVVIDEVPLAWKGVSHPLAGLASIENQNHSFQLPLLGTMEATLAQVNAKSRRKKFRAQVRRLEAIGGFDYVVAESAAEQHDLLDCFFAQKGARLKAFGLPDVFAPPATRCFLHRLLDAPARGTDRPLAMHAIRVKGEHDGHIAAVTGLSRKGGHVLCQFSSIDESVGSDASPGELLFWLAVEHSIEAGASLFDFGIGDQPYKRSWCSQETVQHDILLPVGLKGLLLAWQHLAVTRAKTIVKRNDRLYAMAQRWRSRHGSGQD
jgi:CelD/BcsL family acetyltransferase involved in cellulose biosynthesis